MPLSFSLTINGVAQMPVGGTLEIHEVMNERSTATFDIVSEHRAYRVPEDATVSITENAAVIHGGLVIRPMERGLVRGSNPGIRMPVTTADFNAYIDRRVALTTIPAGTMKAAFEQLRSEYLDGYGVTLHGSQVDGPMLPYIEFGGWKLRDAFDHLLVLASEAAALPVDTYTYRIDSSKVLRVYQPTTVVAPFDLIGNDLSAYAVGDIEVESFRDSTYANKIIFRIPATATSPDIYVYAEDFAESAANGVVDFYDVLRDNPTEAVAQTRADAELAKRAHIKRIVRYRTFKSGLYAGMSQTINVPARNVNVTGVISEIVTRDFGHDKLVREVTVTVDSAGTNVGRRVGDTYREWTRDEKGSGQVASTVFAPSPPDTSVQFNNNGVFGGDAAFTYNAATNSVVCGLDCDITAVDAESCQVFGFDNHIADP